MKTPDEIAHEKNPHCTYQHWQHGAGVPHVMRCGWMADGARAGMIEALRWVQTTGYSRSMLDELLIEAKIAELEKP